VAARLALRPARGSATFGLKRAEILSAQGNGLTLLVLAGVIVVEAIRRLLAPPSVDAHLILAIALVGIVVNVTATWVLA
jgi:cobalt-zinc-cadmium efflux system protein